MHTDSTAHRSSAEQQNLLCAFLHRDHLLYAFSVRGSEIPQQEMNFQELEIFVLTSPEDSDAIRREEDKKAPPAAHGRQAEPLHRSYFLRTESMGDFRYEAFVRFAQYAKESACILQNASSFYARRKCKRFTVQSRKSRSFGLVVPRAAASPAPHRSWPSWAGSPAGTSDTVPR